MRRGDKVEFRISQMPGFDMHGRLSRIYVVYRRVKWFGLIPMWREISQCATEALAETVIEKELNRLRIVASGTEHTHREFEL